MLRSTTGSYGQLVIDATYVKALIHSTKAVWEMIAREEWLGCRHDASPMFDIPRSTPMWAQWIIFRFSIYKTYVYGYCFKNLYVV